MALTDNLLIYLDDDVNDTTGTWTDSHAGMPFSRFQASTVVEWDATKSAVKVVGGGGNDQNFLEQDNSGDHTFLDMSSPYTIAGWIFIDDYFTDINSYISILSQDNLSTARWLLFGQDRYNVAGTLLRYYHGTSGSISETISSPGGWYFCIAWWDGNNQNLQVNNGSVQSATRGQISPGSYDAWRIGAIGTDGIDDGETYWFASIGVWQRVLTAQERTDLYNSGTPLKYADLSPSPDSPDYHFVFEPNGVRDKISGSLTSYPSGVAYMADGGLENDAQAYGQFNGTNPVNVIASYNPPQLGYISCWIRTSSTGSRIRYFGSDDAFEGTKESNGDLSNQCFHSGNATETSGTDYGDGNWYHLVLTWDYALTTAEIYVDKVLQASTFTEADDIPGVGDFFLGGRTNYWNGDIADFRIYENTLPSAQDIEDLYNAGTVPALNYDSLKTNLQIWLDDDIDTVGGTWTDSHVGMEFSLANGTGSITEITNASEPGGVSVEMQGADSTGDYLKQTNSADYTFLDVDSDNTIVGWIYIPSAALGKVNDRYIMLFGQEFTNSKYYFYSFSRYFPSAEISGYYTLNSSYNDNNEVTGDSWHFLVGRYDVSATTWVFWINGIEVDNDPTTPTAGMTPAAYVAWAIGGHDGKGVENISTPFKFAQIGVWDRYLTDAEVNLLYNSGDGISYSDLYPGPVEITPVAAQADTATIAPNVVVGSIDVTPNVAESQIETIDPTVVRGGVNLTPNAVQGQIETIAPTVIVGSIAITPVFAEAQIETIDPVVVAGSIDVTPNVAESQIETIDPTVVVGGVNLTPDAVQGQIETFSPLVIVGDAVFDNLIASAQITALGPTVVVGSIAITPVFAEAQIETIDPTVVLGGVNLTPNAVQGQIETIDPTVVLSSVGIIVTDVAEAQIETLGPIIDAGGILVRPAQAEAQIETIDPTVVLGNVNLTPNAVQGQIETIAPTVIVGSIAITPVFAEAQIETIDPTVLTGGSGTRPIPVEAQIETIAPTVIVGSIVITPVFAEAQIETIGPRVSQGGELVRPAQAEAQIETIAPTVILGAVLLMPNAAQAQIETIFGSIEESDLLIRPMPVTFSIETILLAVIVPDIANIVVYSKGMYRGQAKRQR